LKLRNLQNDNYSTKAPKHLATTMPSDLFGPCYDGVQTVPLVSRRCKSDRRFSEMMRAMSFIAKWIEFLSVGIVPDLTDRIAIFFWTYNLQE
jgi:hypothetical protein